MKTITAIVALAIALSAPLSVSAAAPDRPADPETFAASKTWFIFQMCGRTMSEISRIVQDPNGNRVPCATAALRYAEQSRASYAGPDSRDYHYYTCMSSIPDRWSPGSSEASLSTLCANFARCEVSGHT